MTIAGGAKMLMVRALCLLVLLAPGLARADNRDIAVAAQTQVGVTTHFPFPVHRALPASTADRHPMSAGTTDP